MQVLLKPLQQALYVNFLHQQTVALGNAYVNLCRLDLAKIMNSSEEW